MKTSASEVASALNMYYEGMSLNAIRRQLQQTHNDYPSDSTVYWWVDRFSKEAVNQTKDYKPKVGDVWVADETVLRIEGKNLWFWDIIDSKTRFLLASHISTRRTTRDAQTLMESASETAGKAPKIVLTDKLQAYLDGVELTFGAETKHIASKGFTVQPNTNLVERLHGTLKARTKVMRGLKNRESAQQFLDAWLVHYNYLRPHETLKGKTPAQYAGMEYVFRDWADIVQLSAPLSPPRPLRPSTPQIPTAIPHHPKSQRHMPKGGIYVAGSGSRMRMARHPFKGAKRIRRRIT